MQAESLTYFLMSEQYKCIQRAVFAMQAIPPSPHRSCTQTDSHTLMPCRMGSCRESSSASSMLDSCISVCIQTFVCFHALILHSLLQHCCSAVYLGLSTVQLSQQRSLSLLTHLACLKHVLGVHVNASHRTKWSQM